LRGTLAGQQRGTLAALAAATGAAPDVLAASLHQLAREGQVMFDFARDVYRWREVMPVALSRDRLGGPPPEVAAAAGLVGKVRVERQEVVGARMLIVAKVEQTSVEAIFGGDNRFARAKCSCSFFHKSRLRRGPCRHLIALQLASRMRQ
jgi:hypothetical protein